VAIDFDLADEWRLKLAVTSRCLEVDFQPLLTSGAGDSSTLAPLWREYCDLVTFSLSIDGDHMLYRPILGRLCELFGSLRTEVLEPFFQTDKFASEEMKGEVPIEVCVRAPEIDAVTVNLGDLKGNAFAHRCTDWETFPSVWKSHGVYWPCAD